MEFEALLKKDKSVLFYLCHKGIDQRSNVESYHSLSSYKGLHNLMYSTHIPTRKLRFREVKICVPGHIVVDGVGVRLKTQVSLPVDLNCHFNKYFTPSRI